MRLIKLLAYSLLGYVLYELYLGITEGAEAGRSLQGRGSGGGQGRGQERTRRDAGATTGGSSAKGRQVRPEDAGGGQATRTVGRGVVH